MTVLAQQFGLAHALFDPLDTGVRPVTEDLVQMPDFDAEIIRLISGHGPPPDAFAVVCRRPG
ncbi:hypothetical protein D3C85_1796140 [compost metagenome]